MAGETVITVIGNLTRDPELRVLQSGRSVTSFTVASTPRSFDRETNQWKDGEPLFLNCSMWGAPGENLSCLTKGARVIVTGRLRQRSYEDRDGNKRTVYELDAEEVGASLRFATVQIERSSGSGNYGGRSNYNGGGSNYSGGGNYGSGNGGYGDVRESSADPWSSAGDMVPPPPDF